MTKVIIIGGGLSGLSTAWLLSDRAKAAGKTVEIRLLEKAPRTGGKIQSVQEEGFLCEWGPNGFLDNKPHTLELCAGLGITDKLHRSNDNARKRYIFTRGELHRLPENGPSFMKSRLLSWPGKLRLLAEPFAPPAPAGVDETLAAFGRRRLGDEALRTLIAPMASGIFAGDPETMSLVSCFPRIAELERDYGGLFKAMLFLARKKKKERAEGKISSSAAGPGGTLTSFEEGIQFLTDTLTKQLGERVKMGCPVQSVVRNDHGWSVKTAEGDSFTADQVIMAAPAYADAMMLKQQDQPLSDILNAIPYSSLNVICCGYETAGLGHPLDGFGFLVPKEEKRTVLGTLWDSSMFEKRAPAGKALLRSMAGGACRPELYELADDRLLQQVRDDLQVTMNIAKAPCFSRVIRHKQAIPQYVSGHGQRLAAIEEMASRHHGLFFTGNAFRGVGLNDCVASSLLTVERVLERL